MGSGYWLTLNHAPHIKVYWLEFVSEFTPMDAHCETKGEVFQVRTMGTKVNILEMKLSLVQKSVCKH